MYIIMSSTTIVLQGTYLKLPKQLYIQFEQPNYIIQNHRYIQNIIPTQKSGYGTRASLSITCENAIPKHFCIHKLKQG